MPIKKTILIVDDDILFSGAIQGLLEEEGHVVSCRHNGLDAIALSKEQIFDVVLTDYHMPGIRGDVVCRLLRHYHPGVFIIGCSIENQDKAFLSAGADTFVQKDLLIQNLTLLIQRRTSLG